MSRISVIIPTLEEEADLARLLACLDPAREEVIVVDGRSRDGTCDVARSRAGVTLLETRPPRSRQLNAAAARASGDVLLFLHADAIPPRDWREAILRALADERVVGGAFDLAIDAHGTAPRLVAWGARLRSRLSRSPYGDQGLFVRRQVFDEMKGFADLPLMEDLDFSHRLKRRGRIRLLRQRITVSARRWQSAGYLRTTFRNIVLAGCFYLGADPTPLSRWVEPVRGSQHRD